MRFHVVSLPHTNTTRAFSTCAYTEKVRKFCIMMMERGHEVYLYSGMENEAPCTAHYMCIMEGMRRELVGDKHYVEASFDTAKPQWQTFLRNVIAGMKQAIRPRDFICLIAGRAHRDIDAAFPEHMSVEFGVGYSGTFSKFKVFESYAWMHTCYGARAPNGEPTLVDGFAYDTVIPNYFDVRDFPYQYEKGDYYAYFGRFVDRKGYHIAMEACRVAGAKLKLAGPRTKDMNVWYGEYVGELDSQGRGEFLKNARALFVPTQYIEPFGTVAIEAMACGTPVIASDWGAFTETINKHVGRRCHILQDYLDAMKEVEKLNPYAIRKYAVENFSLKPVGKKYELYFERLMTLWDKGWHQLREAA